MDTASILTAVSVVITLGVQAVIFTWKSGAVIRMIEQKISGIDKKLSVEVAELKVRIDDLIRIGRR